MKKTFLTLVPLLVLFTSCRFDNFFEPAINGTGEIIKQQRSSLNNFNKIEASRNLNITIEQSNNFDVVVEANENLIDFITTKTENNTLIITTSKNIGNGTKNVTVKMPQINNILVSSATRIASKGALKGNELYINSSSGANVNLNTEYEYINATSSSGSAIELTGKALKTAYNASSGANINASELLTNETTANASSGAFIGTNTIVKLKAEASSGGNVTYFKNPSEIDVQESSGGNVSNSKNN